MSFKSFKFLTRVVYGEFYVKISGKRVEKWTFKSQEQPSKELTDVEVFEYDPTSPFIVPFDFCF